MTMTIRAAIGTIAACMALLAGVGAGIGWGLGTFAPGYYRSVFHNGDEPWFDPLAVGVGQGLTQGTSGGVVLGLVLVALFLWRDSRLGRPSESPPRDESGPTKSGPPVGPYVGGLLAPWLIVGMGIFGMPLVVHDPRMAYGLGFMILWACLLIILGALVTGLVSVAISAARRRSVWVWGFLLGCFANLMLFNSTFW